MEREHRKKMAAPITTRQKGLIFAMGRILPCFDNETGGASPSHYRMSKFNTIRSRRRGGGAIGVFLIRPQGRADNGADLIRGGGPGGEQLLLLRAELRIRARAAAEEIVRGAAEDVAEAEDGLDVGIALPCLVS